MRYMIIVKATPESEAGLMPSAELIGQMATYHEQLAAAGVLVDGSGLKGSQHGWRVHYEGEQTTVVDGPFAETRELLAGYTIIDVGSRDEALEWSRKFPNPSIDGQTGQIEVREYFELDDFEPGEEIERHRKIRNKVPAIPANMTAVTPHLVVNGASDAIAFYERAFGAVEEGRLPGPDGKIMHAMIRIGGAAIMLNDEFPEFGGLGPTSIGGSAVTIHLYVEDVDAVFAKAIEAGATATMPVADQFWGDRYGQLTDPFGHHWSVATHKKDLSSEEILKGMQAQ